MKKIDSLNQVAEFHKLFDHPILETPQIPDRKRCELRISLLEEELGELKEAIVQGDLVEVADAFCDIQYVLSGAVLEFGLGEIFVGLFNEVQRSNMSKACKSFMEATQTAAYWSKSVKKVDIKQKDDLYLVKNADNNKVLKSTSYSPADLKPMIFSAISQK